MMIPKLLLVATSLLYQTASATDGGGGGKSDGVLPFFLQDPTDSNCLAGEEFQRCSINTLFYVQGSAGHYQIKKRPTEITRNKAVEDDDDGLCLVRKSCNKDHDKMEPLKLAKCSHCGAHEWNILGDAETGYILTYNEKTCVFREEDSNKVMMAPCDSEGFLYTPLQLRFASASDIATMNSPGARLVGAAADGDLKLLQTLISDGIDIHVRDWDDLTALIPAASAGHYDVCKYLIEQGSDVNAADKDGITALMEASIMGHANIVELLLDKGAEVDATASSEVTALWLASSEGKADCMKILLDKGKASADNTRADGITALMTASTGGHADAVQLLLEHGADPRTEDNDGLTALLNAAEGGSVGVLKLLAAAVENDPAYLDHASKTNFTPLILASAHGHPEVARFLIQAGANVEAQVTETAVRALMYAAASDHVDVMKVLVEEGGADLDATHGNLGTALLEAATGGAVEAVRYLVEKGASVDILDGDGVTPLMAVDSNGSLEAHEIILNALRARMSEQEFSDHINLYSHSGGSAAMFAAAGGHLDIVKAMVELGSILDKRAQATPEYLEKVTQMMEDGTWQEEDPHTEGLTALHVAAQGGHLETVEFLIDTAKVPVSPEDARGRTPLLLAIKGNYAEVASVLVKAGANPNTPYVDAEGEEHNLLFDAIMVENDDFAKLLIEYGADLYYTDEKKVSTLLQACHRGLADVVQLLLEKHAASGKDGYLDDASDEGISPLIAAASEGHVPVVKLLVAAKADVNAKDKDQTTALMASSARGHLEVVKELLAAGALVNDQNTDGHTALMFAYNGKNQVDTLWERYSQYIKEAEEGDVEPDDSTGPLIREALDQHIALIELLMKNGADATLKDKEGHAAKDFDFHPDVDAEVLDKEAKAEKVRDESKYEL